MTIYEKLNKAYRVSCPIVSLTTSDPAKSLHCIAAALPKCHVVNWDVAQGFTVPKQPNAEAAAKASGELGEIFNLTEALIRAAKLPRDSVLVVQNAHRFLDKEDVMQAIWNLRDEFKNPRRMLVLMGPHIRIPVELQHDVIELDEPLPTRDELAEVIQSVAQAADITLEAEQLRDSAAASQGLSAFAAEQLAALNLSKANGVSVAGLWSDKCAKINETPGLRVVSGGSFDRVAGLDNAKSFLKGLLSGREKPGCIVYVDEIEKGLGGAAGDSSGVSQDQVGVLLQWMQDKKAAGCLFVGHPGTGKSDLAKTAGAEAEIPTIQLDLGGMKGSLVGESETRIRDALKVVDSVSGGKTLWLATCNSLKVLPPELRRRFKYGTWFFDLPTYTERLSIWTLYCEQYGLDQPTGDLLDQEWTGAEIQSCAEIAWRIGCSLEQAANYIVPVCRSATQQIADLRESASGRFLSASTPGIYQRPVAAGQSQATREID